MIRLPFALALALPMLAAPPARADPADDDARFTYLVGEYFRSWAAAHPTEATDLGLHDHDRSLEDLSPLGVKHEVRRLRHYQAQFHALDGRTLPPAHAADLAMVEGRIAADLLDLERTQPFCHRADEYPSLASETIYVLIKRDFAPAAERLASVVAREERLPSLLAQGARDLVEVPKVNVGIALEELPSIARFFEVDVPAAFASLRGHAEQAALLERFDRANAAVVRALADYRAFVEQRVAPRAVERFAIGEPLLREKLRDEEMIDEPLDALLARGEAELQRLQRAFVETAAKIDSKKAPREVQAELTADHPSRDRVLAETAARLAGLRRFLVEKSIVSLPTEEMPRLEETPPFLRATTMASMFTPGPFETKSRDAIYNVTLPDPSWPEARAEDYLRGALNRTLMDVVSIHEALPGHFVQFLWNQRLTDPVRKYIHASSNSEGWAHYCEQMVLDEGFGDGNPRLRLAQLQDALLRAARFVAAIRMHARGMSFEEAKRLFVEQGYQSAEVAAMEAKRGTEDPTYLVYTYGKLEILRLRDDYRRKLGDRFSLRAFHDAFLAQGAVPLPLVRRALLDEK